MFELTPRHLELITADVNRADISYSHLKYDLIDHICCDLEYEMSQGTPFEKAYEKIKKKIGLRGLQQIQEDTLLLIDKKYRMMKNTMKTFGVIAPILMAIGSLFKIEHWPGAGVMLTLGFFLLCFVFLPSAVYVSYREVSNRKKLFTHITGFLAAFLYAAGFLFKIQHWPWAGVLIFVASVITGLGFIPAFFVNQLKSCPPNQKSAYIFGLIGSFIYVAGFLFKINHWPGASISLLAGTIFLIIIAFPLFIFSHYKNYEHVSSRFIFLCFAIVWFVIPTALITLNVSINAMKGFTSDTSDNERIVRYLTTRNQKLALQAGSPKVSIKEITSKSNELVDYVQRLKDKILSLSAGEPANAATANFDGIDVNDKESVESVLLKEGKALELKNKLDAYRLSIKRLTENDSASSHLIDGILKPSRYMESYWQHVRNLSAINKLSNVQEAIRSVEGIALRSLGKPTNRPLIATTK